MLYQANSEVAITRYLYQIPFQRKLSARPPPDTGSQIREIHLTQAQGESMDGKFSVYAFSLAALCLELMLMYM